MQRTSKIPRSEKGFEVVLPASTSNLGAGFDCFGLALQQYLRIRATVVPKSTIKCRVRTTGTKESAELPRTEENLIYRAMSYTAKIENLKLPPVRLVVRTELPLSRGFGSSAAAIVGGVKLTGLLCDKDISDETVLEHATRFEGHPDNVAAALYGGFVITCLAPAGSVLAIKRPWPTELKVVLVSPHVRVPTKIAREALPRVVPRADAVHNLQRSALFVAALAAQRYEFLWEAMQDRLHQERRETLVPGLSEVLALQRMEGLLGLGLSGAGPTVLAVATANFEEIGETIAACFRRYKIETTWQRLEVDTKGLVVSRQ